MRRALFAGLLLWGSVGIGCKDKETKPTREECSQVGEHIAELIIQSSVDQAEDWYDAIKAAPQADGADGLPSDLPRGAFKVWLGSPPGRTWLMQRKTNVLIGVQQVVDQCVENATKAQVKCLLAAKSKPDVTACDEKYGRKAPAGESTPTSPAPSTGSAPSGSATPGSADGSAMRFGAGSATGSAN